MKQSKWFMRFKKSIGNYFTHNEKKQNADPEVQQFIRAKRKPNNLMDGRTETKWIRKIRDKSWKNRCKKSKQFMFHHKTEEEKKLLERGH